MVSTRQFVTAGTAAGEPGAALPRSMPTERSCVFASDHCLICRKLVLSCSHSKQALWCFGVHAVCAQAHSSSNI